jgi:hypothetical protein
MPREPCKLQRAPSQAAGNSRPAGGIPLEEARTAEGLRRESYMLETRRHVGHVTETRLRFGTQDDIPAVARLMARSHAIDGIPRASFHGRR